LNFKLGHIGFQFFDNSSEHPIAGVLSNLGWESSRWCNFNFKNKKQKQKKQKQKQKQKKQKKQFWVRQFTYEMHKSGVLTGGIDSCSASACFHLGTS
ncbi:MAG: hypothetical protein N6V41_01750, partial [Candidatus Portiera aleyrodidarum]|nr:hypothetical protein [Candidatus Portiera aleyrodidarum]